MVNKINNISIDDIKEVFKKLTKNNNILNKNQVYREFIKLNDTFMATNNFFLSDEIDNNRINFNKISISKQKEILFDVGNNIYEYNGPRIYNENESYLLKELINLIVICDIEFNIDEINIEKKEIFKKFIENEKNINENLFTDIYYNENFSNKINFDLPETKNELMKNKDIGKKYLFKIKINELDCNYFVEANF